MDLISNLPQHILHEILSWMPEKDGARTSILSKTWKETWSTSPILAFVRPNIAKKNKFADQNDPQQMQDLRNYFLNHVGNTLQRFNDQGLGIKHFKLYLDFSDHTLSPLIDYWMGLETVSGLEVLDFNLFGPIASHGERYCLPPNILESKSLVRLILCGWLRLDEAFLNHPINFCSLQELSLIHVYVEEQIIQIIISSCPLIEYMALNYCPGLKFVSIHNLPKLKGVDFRGIKEVAVDAPSLEHFHFFAGIQSTPHKTNVDKCRNLRDICLSFRTNIIITNQWFSELLHKLPLLEILELKECTVSNKMHISSMQLKVLKFTGCYELKEACIDAPKLCSCCYHGSDFTMPTNVSFSNNSSSLQFDVRFNIGFRLGFLKLRNFLQNIKPKNVLASLVLYFNHPRVEFKPSALQGLSVPPPCIKHLHLHIFSDTEDICLPLLIGLLWSCRPAIISIKLNSTLSSRRLIELLCDMLMEKLEEDDCLCNCGHTTRWWHGLKDVKVTSSSIRDGNVVIGRKTLLDALPTLSAGEVISFSLES